MKTKSLGFIGGGRVTKVFLQAFANRNAVFESVTVYDTDPKVLAAIKKKYPSVTIAGSATMAAKQDFVFIALHPPAIIETLGLIQDVLTPKSMLISLAPKVSIEKISSKLPAVKKIARLIPNATSFINEGYNPVSYNSEFPVSDRKILLGLLKMLGHTFEVAESKLEGYAIMSAMLPTYFWFQWKELQSIGMQIGLNEEECRESIHETLKASLNLMYKSGLPVNDVIDLIPVKPIAESEEAIKDCFTKKLLPLFEKIKP